MIPIERSEGFQDADRETKSLLSKIGGIWSNVYSSPRILIGLAIVTTFIIMAISAPLIAPYDPLKTDLMSKYEPPSLSHPLGTDKLGRDILSRLIYGSRVSLLTMGSVGFGMVIGVILGILAGYFRGRVDNLISRFVDIMLAFPSFVLAIVIMAALGRGLMNMTIAIGISISPQLARLARGVALYVRENQFVEAARSFGLNDWYIIWRHIIPHTMTPVVVYCTVALGTAVLTEAALSFLGLGLPPPAPSWGQMVFEGKYVLRTMPSFSTCAGIFIMVLVLGCNLLGDGLRDLLDPRVRGAIL
jgi:peptide/nickel transport system permease protein